MFGFIRKAFFTGLTILSSAKPLNATQLKCISMNNQECKVRPEIASVNSDKPVFHPFSIKTSKWGGSCNNIRIFCFKFNNFCAINKQITVWFIIMQAQTIFFL